jgi:single-stranded DNA-binding protein
MNRVCLLGFVVAPPRRTEGPGVVAELLIATSKADGQEAHRILCWGATASSALRYVKTGERVSVEGRLRTRGGILEVVASHVLFLDGPGKAAL